MAPDQRHLLVGFTHFIAFLVFVAGPVVAGLVLIANWDLLSSPRWVGTQLIGRC